ncbi:hypothetical protein RJT34_29946 [Clitoria ternatea]|uniref:Uncharacterized protein n=1 Tax=Clitoria ternatea TaxID=43366 RepID=A0AAN9I6V8_CLITE
MILLLLNNIFSGNDRLFGFIMLSSFLPQSVISVYYHVFFVFLYAIMCMDNNLNLNPPLKNSKHALHE